MQLWKIIGKKLDKEEYKNQLIEFSKSKSSVLTRDQYQICYNISHDNIKNKICEKYTSFIEDCVNNHSIQEGLSSMFACYWIYFYIGNYIYDIIKIKTIKIININLGLIIMWIQIMEKK